MMSTFSIGVPGVKKNVENTSSNLAASKKRMRSTKKPAMHTYQHEEESDWVQSKVPAASRKASSKIQKNYVGMQLN